MPGPSALPRFLRAAIWALRVQFFVAGALFATWGVHVPSVKHHYGLGEASLAIAMMAMGMGSVVALLYAGKVLARHTPRTLMPVLAVVSTVAIGSLLAPSGYASLLGLMLAYGIAAALFDVAMNDEATLIERESRRPLMSGFHGMFSLGGMAGAAMWSLLVKAGATPMQHLVAAAAVLAVLAFAASAFMLRHERPPDAGGTPLSIPRGGLLCWACWRPRV